MLINLAQSEHEFRIILLGIIDKLLPLLPELLIRSKIGVSNTIGDCLIHKIEINTLLSFHSLNQTPTCRSRWLSNPRSCGSACTPTNTLSSYLHYARDIRLDRNLRVDPNLQQVLLPRTNPERRLPVCRVVLQLELVLFDRQSELGVLEFLLIMNIWQTRRDHLLEVRCEDLSWYHPQNLQHGDDVGLFLAP